MGSGTGAEQPAVLAASLWRGRTPLDPSAGKSYEEYMAGDIKKIIQDTAKETAKVASQDLGVVVEDIQADVKHVLRNRKVAI